MRRAHNCTLRPEDHAADMFAPDDPVTQFGNDDNEYVTASMTPSQPGYRRIVGCVSARASAPSMPRCVATPYPSPW